MGWEHLQPQISYENGSVYVPFALASGDFNNDRQSEIVVAYEESDNVDILVVYNSGSFINQTKYSTDTFPYYVAVADFNNDTRLDTVRHQLS